MLTVKRLAVAGAVLTTIAGLTACGASKATTLGTTVTSQTTAAAPAETEPPVAEPTYATPKRSDFTLTIKILSKENFGSAGSNITYRIKVSQNGAKTYDPAKTYELTYQVNGGEDGPAVNTLTIQGDNYQTNSEEIASTGSTGDRLTVKVLSVEEA